MKRYVDEATIGVVLGIIVLIATFIIIVKKQAGWLAFHLFFIIFYIYLKYKSTARIVENNREEETKYLDEKGKRKVLPPGQTVTGVDGINTCVLPGKVFKVHNGVNVKITRKGEIKEVNFLSKLYNRSGGGWVSKDFFNEYELQNEWEQLFNC
jgi:hypothetical protein